MAGRGKHEESEREHSNREGRDHPVFVKIIADRWLGSDPPSAQAYARALVQWRLLPGAVATTAGDLATIPDTAPRHDTEGAP
jgi:hypothetical protein